MGEEKEISDFGSGLVICLAKFRSHYANRSLERLAFLDGIAKDKTRKEVEDMLLDPEISKWSKEDLNYLLAMADSVYKGDLKLSVSRDVWLFMNGASDHLYEIRVPKEMEGTEIERLVNVIKNDALEIGHGDFTAVHTLDEVKDLLEMTDKCLILIDKFLGLKGVDKGKYD